MPSRQADVAERFLALHRGDGPFLLPNPWDVGSAKLFASLGFAALATTSSGFAATLGRLDGSVSRDEVVAHAAAIVAATPLPVSTDFEHGFADDPDDVATNVVLLAATGIAGCSVEDFTGRRDDPIYPLELAAERLAAAADALHGGAAHVVLTARAENHLHGRPELADTIKRLQAFQEAGADVLFAPGVVALDDIRAVVESVDRPVNVLAMPGVAPVAELAEIGVKRISVGGAFGAVALGAVTGAARELLDQGTYGYLGLTGIGRAAGREAFGN
jgi:2-methylisocitrate lyase-like PEP mutase family enzyme